MEYEFSEIDDHHYIDKAERRVDARKDAPIGRLDGNERGNRVLTQALKWKLTKLKVTVRPPLPNARIERKTDLRFDEVELETEMNNDTIIRILLCYL